MTAVEWLIEQLEWDDSKIARVIGLKKYNQVVSQAKEMEKQQIIDAHGNQQKKSGGVSNYTYILTGEKYYEETFTNPLKINPK